MSKTITDEKIKLSIIIDGNQGQKELGELENRIRDLNSQQKELRKEKQLLEKQGLKETERYKAVTAAITENSKAITAAKTRMSELQKEVGLTGLTLGQLQAKAVSLRTALRGMIPGTENYKNVKAELAQVTERINELNGKAKAAKFSIGSIADGFNRYAALGASVIATATGVVLSVQKIIDINGKLSDAQSDVMKTTRMTKDEVNELTKSFGLLKTRTQRIDLLNIAKVGGELNIAKDEIFDFVKVMDKAGVALGDSFEGGSEEVATKLGKIKTVYQELKDAKVELAFESVGSALNDLGADGNATAANVAEFTQRVGTMTDKLKPSIAEALGLGAAFEETGLNAEIAGNNYGKLLRIAARDTPKFASFMKMTNEEATKLINTDPTQFFLKFAEQFGKIKDATSQARLLDSLKLNDNEVNMVISAAAKNTDLFRQKIDLANNSLNEATSLTDEFNIKNTNLQATLEKIGKKVSGWFSSESFNNWLFGLVNGFAKLIGATDDVDSTSQKWRNTLVFIAKVIAVVTSALITNVAWQKLVAMWTTRNTEATILYNIASKARAFADGVTIVVTQALAAAQMLLTGNVKGATQAFRVMTATMMTTPWGFILGMVAAIGAAYVMFSDEVEQAATAQSMMADTAKKTSDLVEKESQTFMSLMAIVNDTTASTEARSAALEKAKQIGGEYTKGLTLENAATFEGKKMIDAYVESLEKKMQLQVLEARQKELLQKIQDRKNQKLEEEVNWWDEIYSASKAAIMGNNATVDLVVTASQRREAALKDLQNQLNLTNAEMKEFLKKNPNVINKIDTGSVDAPNLLNTSNQEKNPNSSEAELLKLRLENYDKFSSEYLKKTRQLEDDKIAAMAEGYEKEMALEKLRYDREIEDLQKQKVHATEMAKLDEDIAKAKESKDMTRYNELLQLRKYWQEKNIELDGKVNEIIEGKANIHYLKLATIQEKATTDKLNKEKEQFELEKMERETAYLNEMAALGNNETAKKALTEKYRQDEIAFEEKYLKDKIDKINTIINSAKANINGFEYDFLPEEQKKKLLEQIKFLENAIAKLQAAKNGQTDKSGLEKFGDAAKSAFGKTDILGFSPEEWESTFKNLDDLAGKLAATNMVVTGLQNLWSAYANFQAAGENRALKNYEKSMDSRKKRLKQQLDAGLISQAQYRRDVKRIDDDYEKKKAEVEYKQAKREKTMALVSAVINTARGVAAALPNIVLAGIAAAMGALQIATIARQPLPAKGYEDGLYPEYVRREQDNKVFRSNGRAPMNQFGLYSKPTILVGEGPGDMPEMIVDKRAMSRINPEVRDAFIREMRGVRGFEKGYYDKAGTYQVPTATTPASSNDQLVVMLMQVVERNTAAIEDLKRNGVIGKFFRNDTKSMRELDEGLKDYYSIRNKSKM